MMQLMPRQSSKVEKVCMNHLYRLVWSRLNSIWTAVAESARGQGKKVNRKLSLLVVVVALGTTSLCNVVAAPAGGQVTAGTGTISQTGNTTTINQSTQNLSLSWSQFNVAPQEIVNFVQPSSASIAVNRILSTNGSQILGQINANGQVYLINPNGVLFGLGSQVNVGGLVASTLNIIDTSLTGSIRSFSGNGTGSVINQGSINTPEGGYVALLGNTVSNQGTINSPLGTVALGAGSAATLTFDNNNLVQMQVDTSTLNNLAENKQLIQADGGAVIMSAGAKDSLLASVVNNTGVISAKTLQNKNGVITLLAGAAAGTTNVGGTLNTTALNLGANNIAITNGASINLAAGAGNFTTQQGTGAIQSYTVITTSSDLQRITAVTNFALGGNIDLTSTPFTPITSFNSIFDGLGHTISNLKISGGASTGLFAYVSGATIQNVGLVTGTVTGAASTGALVGNMASTTINNSYAQNIIVTGAAGTGGLVGTVVGTGNSNINNSYATGSVNGLDAGVGGLVGSLAGSGNISNSFATGKVTNTGAATGGLVGSTATAGSITNSCASGDVQGDGAGTGGLVGSSASSGSIISSYATGNVMSLAAGTGGLVGSNTSGAIFQSFASGNVNGGGAGTGGLAGSNTLGLISQSFAVGNVSGTGWSIAAPAPTAATVGASTGGLVGSNSGKILNSYASGKVTGYAAGFGGLVGDNTGGTVSSSYSSGLVTGGSGATGVSGGQVLVADSDSVWKASAITGNPALANINKILTLSNTSLTKVYDGTAYSGTVSLTASCCVSMMTVSLPGLSSNINAGVYSVTPSLTLTNAALAPYFTVAPVTLTVNPLALTGGTISSATSVYGSATMVGALSFTNMPNAGSAVDDTVSLVSPTYSTGGKVNAGSYNQTAAASTTGNYTFATVTSTANNVVSQLLITPTATTNPSVYNGTTVASLSFAPVGLTNDLVSVSGTGTLSSPNAGSNTVAVTGMTLSGHDYGNYLLGSTSMASTAVTTSALALTGGTISSATSTYGNETTLGTLSFYNVPTFGADVIYTVSLVNSNPLSGSGHVNAGSYSQTSSAPTSGNYTYSAVTTPIANNVVNPASLVITVNDSTKVYGTTADLRAAGFTSTGLIDGETLSSVVLSSLGAVNTASVANYIITANTPRGNSAFLASNYLVSDIDGTLSVIPATTLTPTPPVITTTASNSNTANTIAYLQASVQSILKTSKDEVLYQAISSNPLLVNTNLNPIENPNNWSTAYWNSSIQIFNGGINTSLSKDNFSAH